MKLDLAMMWRGTMALAVVGALGCAEEATDAIEVQVGDQLGVKVGALATCGGGPEDPFSDITGLRVIVRHEGKGAPTFDEYIGYGNGASAAVEDVPEGTDEEITLLGYNGDTPKWFARKSGQLIAAGEDRPLSMILSKFGGYSCPKADAEFKHRLFPTATALGSDKFLIAGGLNAVDTTAGTKYVADDASKKAFIYDAATGTMTAAGDLVNARGAHSAVFVEGAVKNRVVIFGGTRAMTFDAAAANKFPWSFETADAMDSVEVFEYDGGADPATGSFRTDLGAQRLLSPRVFANANVISADGLVLVCGGGQWGIGGTKPAGYKECDVYDTDKDAFLDKGKSNNFPLQYRAGGSVLAYERGEVTRLLLVGGVTEGPVIEIYRSSTGQRDGAGGTFIYPRSIPNEVPHQFFQSLTHIGGNKFAMIGGVNWNGANFDSPSPGAAFVLEVVEQSDGATDITAQALGGLKVGRYFHAAAAPATDRLAIVGGFTGTDLTATASAVHLAYNADGGIAALVDAATEETFLARGGMTTVLLDNDTALLVGGIEKQDDLTTPQAGAIQVYTPSNLLPLSR